ncbi:MAG: cation transporter dimerization domain-containing protein [Candidatus Thermoplasmatota archaeon]
MNCLSKFKKEIISFHNVKIVKLNSKLNVKMHLVVKKDMSVKETHKLRDKIEKCMIKNIGDCVVDVHFDPYKED